MLPSIEKEYKQGLRTLIREKGSPVAISLEEKHRWPEAPDLWVATYGWQDNEANMHCTEPPTGGHSKYYGGCTWVLPEEVQLYEVTYSEFQDTFSDNNETVGVNAVGIHAPITCACGQYQDVTLRYEASMYAMMTSLLGLDTKIFQV